MLRALPRVRARWQRVRHLGHRDPHLHLGDLRRSARRARKLYGIRKFTFAMGASSLKVSVSVPPNARTLRAMLPCFCCLHAACARGLLPSALCAKNDDHSRTTHPAVLVLADAIGACSTRPRRGQGGSRPRTAASERLGTRRWRCGRCGGAWDRARTRAAGSTVDYVRVVATHRCLSRSVLPMDSMHARGGIVKS